MSGRIRILIVDDHEVVREGLASALASNPAYAIVGSAADGRSAEQVARRILPDLAIIDQRLPDISGDDLCRRLRARHPGLAVVFLTTYLSEETVRAALDAGAAEYVTKAAGLPALRAAIERVRTGSPKQHPGGPGHVVRELHSLVRGRMAEKPLTPQQERVLELASQGLTNREIGLRLHVTESTVRFHMQKLKARFEARSKTELIAKAIRAGAIAPAPEAMPATAR